MSIIVLIVFIVIMLFSFITIPSAFAYHDPTTFLTTWDVPDSDKTLTFNVGGGDNIEINWGGGDIETVSTGDVSHTYTNAGVHTVEISGDDFTSFNVLFDDNSKLITVDRWGTTQWTTMNEMFRGAINMDVIATDTPDLSLVTDMSYMFWWTDSFNSDLNNWDVSGVTDMYGMFGWAVSFNSDLNNWDVSGVTDMRYMFQYADSFSLCNIASWDTSNAITVSMTVGTVPCVVPDETPFIISLSANDPDDMDVIYSDGDTITIIFDSSTNTPGGITLVQDKLAVDDMFTFTESLGAEYTGQWNTEDTFVITIINPLESTPPVIGITTVTPTGVTPILSADETSEPSTIISPVLVGDFGEYTPVDPPSHSPAINFLSANDPDDMDVIYSDGDTITITFDSNTNTPGGMGIQTKTAVNYLYSFTESLGVEYTGQWNTENTFVIETWT